MKKLSYATLEETKYDGYLLKEAPERVLQFGEGNFLRAFVDYYIDVMNEKAGFNSKVVVCQPSSPNPELAERINSQDGLFTLYVRGFENGKRINDKRLVSCISRCLNPYRDFQELLACAANPALRFITSNTTEAGIVFDESCKLDDTPPASFPGKLTRFLYERFKIFGKEKGKGFIILPCELIDDNGQTLKDCVLKYAVLWELEDDFIHWIEEENLFCSTLVDRIVTGYPGNEADALCAENGYLDELIDTGEVFSFWAIEAPESLKKELPFEKAGLPVLITDNHKPYKKRKVRILNGAHTSMVLGAYLAGQDIVRGCMEDEVIRGYMNKTICDEIIPTLTLPKEELDSFAASVTERFQNPFIDHALLAIALNSTAKWKARVLPTLKDYIDKTGSLPPCLTASFAFYIAFYKGKKMTDGNLVASRLKGNEYPIKDDACVIDFYLAHKDDDNSALAQAVCSNTAFWEEDLSAITGFKDAVTRYLNDIDAKGAYAVMKSCLA